ncbi:MAG TPA: hypothetical protein VLF95_10915 [Vicinamibacteria bacterium]|nr:hypothetical protein [Vicinamibacteria bacterium]
MPDTRNGLPLAFALALAFAGRSGLAQVEDRPASATPPVIVAFELVVEDAKGNPVTDLKLEEVAVVQDATRQKVRTFETGSQPGHYELSYVPLSGMAGGVTVRVTRPGAVARGPDGPRLRPRVISALSPLEAELTRVIEARAGAGDLACDVAALRFEPAARGVRHAVVVEIPLSELRFERGPAGARARLQILARVRAQAEPDVRQLVTLDQAVEVATKVAIHVQRLVWTGAVVIGPGRHTIDVLVRDPGAERVTTRTLAVDVPPPAEGLRMSSVALLRPRGFFFLRDQAEGDDPLVYQGTPLMPTLQLTLTAGAESYVRFYVALYPAAGSPEPVSLKAELLRDGAKVGEGPITLPKPEPSGEVRYVGLLQTRSFRAGSYVLRLVAQQGATAAADEAPFLLSPEEPAIRRLAPDGVE